MEILYLLYLALGIAGILIGALVLARMGWHAVTRKRGGSPWPSPAQGGEQRPQR